MAVAVVTGASSGLGVELARRLGSRGHELVLVARSTGPLEELASELGSATVVAADLASEGGVEALLDAAPEAEILVNNAGFGDVGPFAGSDQGRARRMIELNCAALTALTGGYLPGMIRRGSGQVLNIASTAAFQAGPEMAVYYATKAYVLSFTEAIAEELRGTGVSATAFCPGAFSSGFQAAAKAEDIRLVKGRKLPSSAEIADEALSALDHRRVVAVPGLSNKIGAFMPRLTPRPVMRRVVHYIQREV